MTGRSVYRVSGVSHALKENAWDLFSPSQREWQQFVVAESLIKACQLVSFAEKAKPMFGYVPDITIPYCNKKYGIRPVWVEIEEAEELHKIDIIQEKV